MLWTFLLVPSGYLDASVCGVGDYCHPAQQPLLSFFTIRSAHEMNAVVIVG